MRTSVGRPAVRGLHEHAVEGVPQAHAGREQHGEHEDGVERQAERSGPAGQDEQPDLGRGVEPEAEEHADGVDLPGPPHHAGQAAEQPVEQSAVLQVPLERVGLEGPGTETAEHLDEAHERDEVREAEGPQEQA